MVIDFHAHIFPDALCERAVSSLAQRTNLTPVCRADKASTKAYLKANGVDKMVSLNIAVLPKNTEKVNDFAIASADDFVISFGSLHPDADWLNEIPRLKDHGIKGLKFHPEYQQFNVDDPKCDRMYEACFKAGFVLLFHCGVDLAYQPPQKAGPARFANFAKKYAGERIVAAHLGGVTESDEVLERLSGLGLYADLAAVGMQFDSPIIPETFDAEKVNRVVRMFGADRVLFGTDCPWQSPKSGFHILDQLHLTDEQRQNILHKNAERLLGL